MGKQVKRWILRVAALIGVLAVLLIGYLGYLQLTGNFAVVVEGEVYRSAQVTGTQLEDYTRKYGIKSVLNLRGASPRSEWYQAEVADSARLGLVLVDFELSASREVTTEEATRLIDLMRKLPKPLLIHCKFGSDRTGLISALYLAAISGQDAATAGRQLSLRYGHFSVPYLSAAYPMDISWRQLKVALNLAEN